MIEIDEKQAQVLVFIEDIMKENGCPPTHQEIRTGMEISSKSLVSFDLEAFENATLITRAPNTPRGIQLTSMKQYSAMLPVNEMPERNILDLTFSCITSEQNLFAVKAEETTVDVGFAGGGDIIVIQRQQEARNGELLALRLANEQQTELKRYFRENGLVRLQSPANSEANIFVKPEDVEIQGKVVAVIRQLDI